MDIKKELDIINNDTKENIDEVIQHMDEQIVLWTKKLYILQVVNFANEIERLAKNGFFKKDGITFIHFNQYKGVDFCNETQEIIVKDIAERNAFMRLFAPLNTFDGKLKGKFSGGNVELQDNIKNQVLEIFLNKELKAIVDYNEMDAELKESNISTQKIKL